MYIKFKYSLIPNIHTFLNLRVNFRKGCKSDRLQTEKLKKMFPIKVVDLIEIHIFCCKHFFIGMIVSQKISGKYIIIKEGTPPPSTGARFFSSSKLEYITLKEGTPPPSTRAPFFHTFQSGIYHNKRRHPAPLYRSLVFSQFLNWNIS